MAGAAVVDVDPARVKLRSSIMLLSSIAVRSSIRLWPAYRLKAVLVQGIGMTLTEDVIMDKRGRLQTNSFMQYRIPTRQDVCDIKVEFAPSYEPTGPYGAKSIGEIVINTPGPAIAEAVHQATGVYFRELPIIAEKVYKGLKAKKEE